MKCVLISTAMLLCFVIYANRAEAKITTHLLQTEFNSSASASTYKMEMISVPLDYDNTADKRTFKDRYFVISDYASGPDAPVIFQNWGETEMVGVPDREHFEADFRGILAKSLHAYYVGIEHRYFGQSQPFDTLTTKNMRFLRVDYALKDMAYLQRYLTQKRNMHGKWVAYAASYPGGLALFYREKFPDLITGAIAFSPQIQFSINDYTWDQYSADQMGPTCTQAFNSGVMRPIENSFGHLQSIKNAFSISDDTPDLGFLAAISWAATAGVQFGLKDSMCQALSKPDPLIGFKVFVGDFTDKILKKINMTLQSMAGGTQDSIKVSDNDTGVGMRQWNYLGCSQLGAIETVNPDSTRSVSSPLLAHIGEDACKATFGMLPDIEQMTKTYYLPLLDPKLTSRIVIINETEDPSTGESISTELGNWTNPRISVLTVKGGSHSQGSSVINKDDPPAVKQMQSEVLQIIQHWVAN